jgi:hypothetical protein
LKPTDRVSPAGAATAVCCDVAAYGAVRATPEQVLALRQKPALAPVRTLPSALLKHADEQTVVAIAAVWQALDRFKLTGTCFTDWGVVAAPRFLGRAAMAAAVQRFAAEGAWGISPHLIPHRSLHSLSGTVSQALAIHGPNFGIGGGPDGASEIFLSISALLEREQLPGMWLVVTGWDSEPIAGRNEPSEVIPSCGAVALALVATSLGTTGLRLRIAPRDESAASCTVVSPEALLATLEMSPLPATTRWQLSGGGHIELGRVAAGAIPVTSGRLAG